MLVSFVDPTIPSRWYNDPTCRRQKKKKRPRNHLPRSQSRVLCSKVVLHLLFLQTTRLTDQEELKEKVKEYQQEMAMKRANLYSRLVYWSQKKIKTVEKVRDGFTDFQVGLGKSSMSRTNIEESATFTIPK